VGFLFLFFGICHSIWAPKITSIDVLSNYGFIPNVNLSLNLFATQSGLAVYNQLNISINVICNNGNISSILPGRYSDYSPCLFANQTNKIVVLNGETIIFQTDFVVQSLGQFFLMDVQNTSTVTNATILPQDVDYTCFFQIKAPYGVGTSVTVINPLHLICPVPVFPLSFGPEAGGIVTFDGLGLKYPTLHYSIIYDIPFILQAYWDSAALWNKNGSIIQAGDMIQVEAILQKNLSYSCSFSLANHTIQSMMKISTEYLYMCSIPDEITSLPLSYGDNIIQLDIWEKNGNTSRVVMFINDKKPSFTFQLSFQNIWQEFFVWFIVGIVVILLALIVCASVCIFCVCRGMSRRSYYQNI